MAGKFIDEIGNTYGRLTVIGRAPNKNYRASWICRCQCGNEITVIGKDLRSGHTTSCGCYAKEISVKDLTGQRFNSLVVIKRAGTDKNRNALWECLCDCGNTVIVSSKLLRSNHKLSCGCNTRSRGELYVKEYLINKNILFKEEYKFIDLIDKFPLRFDFVILQNEKPIGCIEVQGSQHYYKNDGYYKESMIHHDYMKRTYCQKNNLPLLELDYSKHFYGTDFTKWNEQLENFIKRVEQKNDLQC